MSEKEKELKKALREAQGRVAEYQHAMEHIVSCDTGTKLCPDCEKLAKAAIKGQNWVHFVDE